MALRGPPGSFGERVFCLCELLGMSLGKRALHWRVLDTEFIDPMGKCMMARYTIIQIFFQYFNGFQRLFVVEKEGSGGANHT